ncbi:hypothetical protein GCM10012280_11280 [Wenjunlia tyrosinilytica]|uniref:Uncharacterized protein n=1 Tax=Wenjunlia tyrosinilytica TaxID=1544741 RepID=A0A917ZHY1_9ACTN|nr:hypothetical protein GCM10012280_11280 [Wenjunlia tyrosinilytica]
MYSLEALMAHRAPPEGPMLPFPRFTKQGSFPGSCVTAAAFWEVSELRTERKRPGRPAPPPVAFTWIVEIWFLMPMPDRARDAPQLRRTCGWTSGGTDGWSLKHC